MINDDKETATDLVAKYKSAAEENGTSIERRRVHEHAGYLAMLNEDNATVMAELALANNLDPIVLYWSAVANLPFFRADALQLIDELSGM